MFSSKINHSKIGEANNFEINQLHRFTAPSENKEREKEMFKKANKISFPHFFFLLSHATHILPNPSSPRLSLRYLPHPVRCDAPMSAESNDFSPLLLPIFVNVLLAHKDLLQRAIPKGRTRTSASREKKTNVSTSSRRLSCTPRSVTTLVKQGHIWQ